MADRFVSLKIGTIAAVMLGLGLFDVSTVTASESKRIMMLHSFGPDFKPWNEYSKTIRAELNRQSPWPLDISDFSLVGARFGEDKSTLAFSEYLHTLYADHQLDLIITVGAPAANFIQRQRRSFFPSTPMLLTVVERRRVNYPALTSNDAVVAVAHDFPAIFENILHVLPDTKTVMIINGASPSEMLWLEDIRKEVKSLENRISFVWTNDLSFADIQKKAATLPPHSAIFYHLMNVDAIGGAYEGDLALSRLHAVANSPIFSYADVFFGRHIVGGPMHSVIEQSRRTAEIAIRILAGEKPGDLKIAPVGFATPKFDWREMQRWGISEASLLPGSTVHFRELTAWERYWSVILLVLAALLLQAGLIGWLIYEHRRRHLAEVQSRSAIADLTYMNRMATAAQLSATLSHEVNQPLTGIVTRASAALNWLRREKPDLEKTGEALENIVRAAQRASGIVSSVRGMFKKENGERTRVDLNDTTLTVLEIVRIDLQAAGIKLELKLQDGLPAVIGDRVRLQQAVLNLVMNAIEAMRAEPSRNLRLQTEQSKPGLVHLLVSDTGEGIAASSLDEIFKPLFTTKPRGMGMGLAICRSIIESHGGRIWVSPEPTGGAEFHIELPTKE
jgi:signal transduction histidine kinase